MADTDTTPDLNSSRRLQDDTATLIPHSGNLEDPNRKGTKTTRFKDDDEVVEITLDVQRDSVAIEGVRVVDDGGSGHVHGFDGLSSSSTRSGKLASKLRQVTNGLKLTSASNKTPQSQLGKNMRKRVLNRTKSGAAVALRGLQFVTTKIGHDGWPAVEKRFNHLQVDGLLLRSRFGKCIGNSEVSVKLCSPFSNLFVKFSMQQFERVIFQPFLWILQGWKGLMSLHCKCSIHWPEREE
jgi:respiratory burst oxidase